MSNFNDFATCLFLFREIGDIKSFRSIKPFSLHFAFMKLFENTYLWKSHQDKCKCNAYEKFRGCRYYQKIGSLFICYNYKISDTAKYRKMPLVDC